MVQKSRRIPVHGWLVVNKTAGHTSSAVVQKLKWLLNAEKVGHAGTLDPDATGILAIALGEATKTIQYLTQDLKGYIFTVALGASTTTDDASGQVIQTSSYRPDDKTIRKICKCFLGKIKQVPPTFSAVKIKGQRAYQIARKGYTNFKLAERDLWISELEMLERINEDKVKMKLICGKGGYVRSIARDMGEKLGCFGHVIDLTRVSSGPFSISHALLDKFIFEENVEKVFQHIRPVDSTLGHLAKIECTLTEANEIQHGKAIKLNTYSKDETMAFVCFMGTPIAIGKILKERFYPKKVLRLL